MTIWLTGCTAGIGRALVSGFIKAGHRVVGCGRNEIALAHLKKEFPSHHFLAVDVTQNHSVEEFCTAALALTGPPDLLINNAAVINKPAPLWEVTSQEFDELTAVNINGVANVIRHALPSMLVEEKGVIVNFSSGWGRTTSPHAAPYCASKWAIEGLTQALAAELPNGMAAVALSPGCVATDMLRRSMGEAADDFRTPEVWAESAVPYILALDSADNGTSVTTP